MFYPTKYLKPKYAAFGIIRLYNRQKKLVFFYWEIKKNIILSVIFA